MKNYDMKEIERLNYEYLKLKEDFEEYKEKTIDKMKDLEFLNIQYEKVKKENEELKKKNTSVQNEKNIMQKEIDQLRNELDSKSKLIDQITKNRDSLLTKIYSNNYNNNELNEIKRNISLNTFTNEDNEIFEQKRKEYILSILTFENFSLDIYPNHNLNMHIKNGNSNNINNRSFSNSDNFEQQNQQDSINREKELIKKIDEVLQKIQIKKEKLLNNKINANSRYDK
jgi:hypothetical protein